MSVTYLTTPIAEARRDYPRPGSGMTRAGYTKTSGAPSSIMIRLQGEKRWRRLMVWQFSNLGTLFVRLGKVPHVVREEDLPPIQEKSSTAHAKKKTSHSKMLSGLPVVLSESVTMPNGKAAEIQIHHGKGGFGAVLVYPDGRELPMSYVGTFGRRVPDTAIEAMKGAKRFLAKIYGRSN